MNKYICIHGHFYQPPRENPWLEEIELQDSAYPYKDWNARITSECYAPNVASRILDHNGEIADIINNYAKINFNFGPTLLSWLEREEPDIYMAILKADKSSRLFFDGNGSAIAQGYNHMILPLANERDKHTQVIWGIQDFKHRFQRDPKGMWLPETAVDVATLEVLAEHGIEYTILAPYQAQAIREKGKTAWNDLKGHAVSSRQAYACPLPSGNVINICFYDGGISHEIAFAGLLNNGENFAKRLAGAFSQDPDAVDLVHVATDGETYGHHHRFGNMALAYCLSHIESDRLGKICSLSQFLQEHPPTHEVKLKDVSAWSCAHGVERWQSDCGCCIGGHPWNQKWRRPLRESLNWLRDSLIEIYEKEMSVFTAGVWQLRDEYIRIILDRSEENVERFFDEMFPGKITLDERVRVLKLLEMQRHAMFMFTSCGWFFDEISGIEAVQIMRYAARAMQLARETSGKDFEPGFLERLSKAKSNLKEFQTGKEIYQRFVKTEVIDLLSVGAHFAISSLFQVYPDSARVYSYQVDVVDSQLHQVDDYKLLIGTAEIRSLITWERARIDFAVFHFGGYHLHAGVCFHEEDKSYTKMHDDLVAVFAKNDIEDMIQNMTDCFGDQMYSLWDLFKNEQSKVMEEVFENTLTSIEKDFRDIYARYFPLMQMRPDFRIPLPKTLGMSIEFVLNRDLALELKKDKMDFEKMEGIVREMKRWNFTRDKEGINLSASRKLDAFMQRLMAYPRDNDLLHTLCDLLKVCRILPLDLDIWRAQNIYFSLRQRFYPQVKELADQGDSEAQLWVIEFERLSGFLKVQSP